MFTTGNTQPQIDFETFTILAQTHSLTNTPSHIHSKRGDFFVYFNFFFLCAVASLKYSRRSSERKERRKKNWKAFSSWLPHPLNVGYRPTINLLYNELIPCNLILSFASYAIISLFHRNQFNLIIYIAFQFYFVCLCLCECFSQLFTLSFAMHVGGRALVLSLSVAKSTQNK